MYFLQYLIRYHFGRYKGLQLYIPLKELSLHKSKNPKLIMRYMEICYSGKTVWVQQTVHHMEQFCRSGFCICNDEKKRSLEYTIAT